MCYDETNIINWRNNMKKNVCIFTLFFLLTPLFSEEVICPYCNNKFTLNKTDKIISKDEYKLVNPYVFKSIYSDNEEKLNSKLCMENLKILQFFENSIMQMLTDNYSFIEIYIPDEDMLMELINLTGKKITVYGRTIKKQGTHVRFQLDKYELCN